MKMMVEREGVIDGVTLEVTIRIPGPRIGRGRWRRVKALLCEFFDGPVPPQEYWCAEDLANEQGFRARDVRKYMGRGRRRSSSAKARRQERRQLGECSACGRRFRLSDGECPRCGEVEIPF